VPPNVGRLRAASRVKRSLLALLTLTLLCAAAVVNVVSTRPPPPQPGDAAANRFSGGRAMRLVASLAAEPHPLGSAAEARVRDKLVLRLRQVGLSPEVRTDTVLSVADAGQVATVHNVVALLRGTRSRGTIALIAHYDSGSGAPGAADDASGAAVVLETLRALRAGPRLKDDVLAVFTDGEELGQFGISSFLNTDPLAKNVRVALNLDNPGSSGPLLMDQSTRANAWLVHELAAVHAGVLASSLMDAVARGRDIGSGFTPLYAAEVPGLSFAFSDGRQRYDTALDTTARLNPASVQHEGSVVLALTHRLGQTDLAALHRGEVVYFDPAGLWLVVYDRRWAVPLALLAGGLFAAVVIYGVRRRAIGLRGALLSSLFAGLALCLAVVGVGIVETVLRGFDGTVNLPGPFAANDEAQRVGLVALGLAACLGLFTAFLRERRFLDVVVGCLGWWLAGAVLTALRFPAASYLFVWPLLFALAGLAFLFRGGQNALERPWGLLITSVAALPGLLLLSSSVNLLFMAAGLRVSAAVFLVWLAAALLIPQLALLEQPGRWPLPAGLAVAAVIVLVSGAPATAGGSAHSQPDTLLYRAQAGSARWIDVSEDPEAPAPALLGPGLQLSYPGTYILGVGVQHYSWVPAPVLSLPAPTVRVLSDRSALGRRVLQLRIRSVRGAPGLSVVADSSVGVLDAIVNGTLVRGANTSVPSSDGVRWRLDYYGMPASGARLSLFFAARRRLRLTVADYSYGLPPRFAPLYATQPPAQVTAGIGDATVVERTFAFAAR
jgi:hypothetical protein